MQRHVDQDYEEIRQLLLEMGGQVEQMVADATRALTERDSDLAFAVMQADRQADRMEKQIDEACQSVMARQQPAAVDLRFLVAVMKIGNDLERIGDSAANMARAARELNQEPPLELHVDVPRLSRAAQLMVHDSLDALVQRDPRLALAVWERDDNIDSLYRQIFRELVQLMAEQPKTVSRALHVLLVSRNLERIADHATNIAEDVIYYVEGKDIRHSATDYGTKED